MLSTIWYGVQLWFGALVRGPYSLREYLLINWQALKVSISAIIPGFRTMRNTLSGPVATNDLISLMILYIISLALHSIAPQRFRTVGKAAGIAVLVTFISLVSVCLAEAKGAGP